MEVYTGTKYQNVRPEGISSAEIGYGISYSSLKVKLNAYYTLWTNKTTNSITPVGAASDQTIFNNVRNINARHMGVELSVVQEISRRVQLTECRHLARRLALDRQGSAESDFRGWFARYDRNGRSRVPRRGSRR